MIRSRRSLLLAITLWPLAAISSFAADSLETIYTAPNRGANPIGALHQEADGSFVLTTAEGGIGGRGGVFRVSSTGEVQHLASFFGANGILPVAGVTRASDGNYYGTTVFGGPRDAGTIFRITPAGVLTTIAKFRGSNGALPDTRLVEVDGALYGTASSGGSGDRGVVFRVSLTGTLTVLANFAGPNGGTPAGLTLGSDGNLYGVTSAGGANEKGTVFRVTTGGVFSSLASFDTTNGASPNCPMTLGADGALYGVTSEGGANQFGTFFKFDPANGITKLADFSFFENGGAPHVPLLEESAGVFVGLTRNGGNNQNGVFFRATSAGVLSKIADLPTSVSGFSTQPLLLGDDGAYYTATELGGSFGAGEIIRLTSGGVISSFSSFGTGEGTGFVGTLAATANGTLFGTTIRGGAKDRGVLFKITTGGLFEQLNDFTPQDFSGPNKGLTLGSDGNFYGTTGFSSNGGSIFQATPAGGLTNLATFDGNNGANPAGILEASDGAFYGVTATGGADGKGVVFKYSTAQGLEALSNLSTTTAQSGAGRLVESSDGFFYGATTFGGSKNLGSIIRVGSNGAVTVIASFNGNNGAFPNGALLEAADGNLYGLVTQGGLVNGGGVYRVTPAGKLSLVASFNGFNGAFPLGGLVSGPRGDLYGVASAGGQLELGTVFRFSTKKKTITAIHSFDGANNGAFPLGDLAVGSDFNLYGTTHNTIFRVAITNSAPVPQNDTFDLPVFNVKPTKNDKDEDKDQIRIISVGTAAHGDVVVHEDNTISYLPSETFTDTDTFSYTVTDGFSTPVTAQITVRQPLNPLKAGVGAYGGLVLNDGGGVAGYWGIIATKQGLFTGALRLDGQRYSVRGIIVNGQFSTSVMKKDGSIITITGTVDPGRNLATGTIEDGDDTYVLELYRTFPLFTRDQPTPAAGRYTILLPPDPLTAGNAAFPQGTGYVIMNVSATGIVTVTGKLGDGTAFSAGSLVTRDNNFPLYGEAYKKKGYIAGLIDLTAVTPQSDASAVALFWMKPAETGTLYPGAFVASPGFLASKYQRPSKKQTALSLSTQPEPLELNFDGLGLFRSLSLSVKNVATIDNPGADNTKVVINPKSGFFTGKFTSPVDNVRRPFGGVLFQKTQRGEGTYLGAASSGTVELLSLP